MANEGDEGNDLYAVLGLNKDCSESELRHAYKKLALKWHPDRWSASGNSKLVEEAKKKFQAIREAYSVLSDAKKRFLYDVGVYDSDDDGNGMGEFLNELASMMSQTTPNENGEESLEELQQLFEEMLEADNCIPVGKTCYASACSSSSPSSSSSSSSTNVGYTATCTSNFDISNFGNSQESFHLDHAYHSFCFGMEGLQDMKKGKGERRGGSSRRRRRQSRKQRD